MKVDTIRAIFELNQSILDEGWYESKHCDTIQTRHTQDQRKQLIWINTFWFDSYVIRFKDSWSESKLHDHQKIRTKRINDMIQTNLNRIKNLEKWFSHTKTKVYPHKDKIDTQRHIWHNETRITRCFNMF